MAILEDNREIIEEFVAECSDNLGEVEAILIEMENGDCSASDDVLNQIFRAFHSVKGTAGFLELEHVVNVTHWAESLLDKLRKGELVLQPSHVTLFLRAMDCVNRALPEIGTEGTDLGIADLIVDVCTEIEAAMKGKASAPSKATPEASPPKAKSNPEVVSTAVQAPTADSKEATPNTATTPEKAVWEDEEEFEQGLIEEFVTDSLELLDTVDASLSAAEQDGCIPEEVASAALRGLHTIKGNCGFLGFFELGELCHSTEDALQRVAASANDVLAPIFDAVDALKKGITQLGNGGGGSVPELKFLCQNLKVGPHKMPPSSESVGTEPSELFEEQAATLEYAPTKTQETEATSEIEAPTAEIEAQASAPQASEDDSASTSGETAVSLPDSTESTEASNEKRAAAGGIIKAAARQSIRVDTGKLDELMNLVGELIIAENMVTQNEDLEGYDFENFHKASLHLNRITRSLQDLTMSVRMVPIRPTFRKMLRVARDVAQKQDKDVELLLTGEDTEVDRSVVESIGDPLVHLLRNAVDHGVEDKETRLASGKSPTGNLSLSAHHEGGEVWVTLRDDGKGLNRDFIVEKAIKKGLIVSGDDLTDAEVFQLICEPGFSTAEVLSDISGRGVGMDVVRRNIEKLRGRLEITSELGKGTTFTMRIPLTLAIVEGMQVAVGPHSYTIPLFAIRESVAVDNNLVSSLTDGGEVLELRGEFIPVVRLSEVHSVEARAESWEEGVFIVISDAGLNTALFVDEILGQRQTVVKPLPKYLGDLKGLAGCSILSTGRISLVLDVQSLTERLRIAA